MPNDFQKAGKQLISNLKSGDGILGFTLSSDAQEIAQSLSANSSFNIDTYINRPGEDASYGKKIAQRLSGKKVAVKSGGQTLFKSGLTAWHGGNGVKLRFDKARMVDRNTETGREMLRKLFEPKRFDRIADKVKRMDINDNPAVNSLNNFSEQLTALGIKDLKITAVGSQKQNNTMNKNQKFGLGMAAAVAAAGYVAYKVIM
ncbi:MAG: hypothetical protein ABEK04_03370 [Candidatus Nanohalobium sp.]